MHHHFIAFVGVTDVLRLREQLSTANALYLLHIAGTRVSSQGFLVDLYSAPLTFAWLEIALVAVLVEFKGLQPNFTSLVFASYYSFWAGSLVGLEVLLLYLLLAVLALPQQVRAPLFVFFEQFTLCLKLAVSVVAAGYGELTGVFVGFHSVEARLYAAPFVATGNFQ